MRSSPQRSSAARNAGATSASTASRGASRAMLRSPTTCPAVRGGGRLANRIATSRLSSGGM
eukprot:1010502-Alexandrium_andersonii.AAC.1